MKTKKINVLICDDHSVFREGVRSILSGEPDLTVIGQAGNGAEGVKKARELHPDVVLMDIAMPVMRGFDATRRIVKIDPHIRVLMLTVYDDEDLVARCLSAGAAGYVLKDAPPEQLVYSIRTVARGERYLSPKALKGVIGGLTDRSTPGVDPLRSAQRSRTRNSRATGRRRLSEGSRQSSEFECKNCRRAQIQHHAKAGCA